MGRIALAAKVTHEGAAEGHVEIGRRARALGVDTIVVFDSHWRAAYGYGVNCNTWLEGQVADIGTGIAYAHPGNPLLGHAIAGAAARRGVRARVHLFDNLGLECGAAVPLRAMNADQHFKVVTCAAALGPHPMDDSRAFGAGVREAIVESDSIAMVLACGSLSRTDRGAEADETPAREFNRQLDLRVLELWRAGDWRSFCAMLPDYALLCRGDGGMHDTAMLLGLLGWDEYDSGVEIISAYCSSPTGGGLNAIFPVG